MDSHSCTSVGVLSRLLVEGHITEGDFLQRKEELFHPHEISRPTGIHHNKRTGIYSPYDLFDDTATPPHVFQYSVYASPSEYSVESAGAFVTTEHSFTSPPIDSWANNQISDSSALISTSIQPSITPNRTISQQTQPFHVTIMTTSGDHIPINISPFDNIKTLKQNISQQTKEHRGFLLFFNGKELDNDAAVLQESSIQSGDIIYQRPNPFAFSSSAVSSKQSNRYHIAGLEDLTSPVLPKPSFQPTQSIPISFGTASTPPITFGSPSELTISPVVFSATKSSSKPKKRKVDLKTPKSLATQPNTWSKCGGNDGEADPLQLKDLLNVFWYQKLAPLFLQNESSVAEFIGPNRPWTIPTREATFRALHSHSPEDFSVVIFGQDPYPRETSATGVAFYDGEVTSWQQKLSPSLKNIIKSAMMVQSNVSSSTTVATLRKVLRQGGIAEPPYWFEHTMNSGVLWLNTALTFSGKEKTSLDHHTKFWAPYIREIIRILLVAKQESSLHKKGIVFALWGKNAQKLQTSIRSLANSFSPDVQISFCLASHPCTNSFCTASSACAEINQELAKMDLPAIDWAPQMK